MAELVLDCLDDTDGAFYSTSAQVGPVLALALFVEMVVVMGPVLAASDPAPGTSSRPPMTPERAAFRALVRMNAGLFLISESAALYAVGAEDSSTFLVVCVVLPWLVQLLLLVDTAYYRVGFHRLRRR